VPCSEKYNISSSFLISFFFRHNKRSRRTKNNASSTQMALNLAVLQRLDAKINQILATAGHVALYKFLPATQAWVRHAPRKERIYINVIRAHLPQTKTFFFTFPTFLFFF